MATEKISFKMVLRYNLMFYIQTANKTFIKKEENQIIKDRVEQLNRVIKENKNF